MFDVPVLRDTDVDGVRVLWVPSGRPTLSASLTFRFGSADEPVTESGWQHLVEHLCLEANPGAGLDMNGSVSLYETTFDAHGEPEAVAAHLSAIVRWLRAPSLDAVAHERRVLRAEAAARGSGPVAEALSWRYGARGPGLCAYAEPGLGRADAPGLNRRIGEVFTAGNAVLALDGPPPAGLDLALPAGTLRPVPPAVACETGPAGFAAGALTLSGVVPREGSMFAGVALLERAVRERLRGDTGAAYAPWATYERVDRDHAVVVAGSDFTADATGTVGNEMLGVVRRLADEGPPSDWLREEIERTVRRMNDPYAVAGIAFGGAHRYLHGHPPETFEDALDRIRSVTVEQVAHDMTSFRDSLLLGGPPIALAPVDLRRLEMEPTEPRPGGAVVHSINAPGDDSRLHLHPEQIVMSGGERPLGVAIRDVSAYLVFDDGGRHLLREDGYGLSIDPRW